MEHNFDESKSLATFAGSDFTSIKGFVCALISSLLLEVGYRKHQEERETQDLAATAASHFGRNVLATVIGFAAGEAWFASRTNDWA